MTNSRPRTNPDSPEQQICLLLRMLALLAIALASEPLALAEPRIDDVNISRTPPVCSLTSLVRRNLDIAWGVQLQALYAAVTATNPDVGPFAGVLIWESSPGDIVRMDRIALAPLETRVFHVPMPVAEAGQRMLFVSLGTIPPGFWPQWIPIRFGHAEGVTIDVKAPADTAYPQPQYDCIGATMLVPESVKKDNRGPLENALRVFSAVCTFGKWPISELLSAAPPVRLVCVVAGMPVGNVLSTIDAWHINEKAAAALNQMPSMVLYASSLDETLCRHATLRWWVRERPVYIAGGLDHPGELYSLPINVAFDRALVTLRLPLTVGVESCNPPWSDDLYVNDTEHMLVWIVNGVDKRIMPNDFVGHDITFDLRESPGTRYSMEAALFLQLGPFGDATGLANMAVEAPRYNYTQWQDTPCEATWLTLATAYRRDEFSSRPADIEYLRIFSGFVSVLYPELHVGNQIRSGTDTEGPMATILLDEWLNPALDAVYRSQLRYSTSGASNVDIQIDEGTRTVKVSTPRDWHGEEEVRFTATDALGRTESHRVRVLSPLLHPVGQGDVYPRTGTRHTSYTFSAVYTEPGNAYPRKAVVIINGIPHNMTKAGDSEAIRDGARFAYSGTLPFQHNSFYFEFDDGTTSYTYPPDGNALEGPSVELLHDMAIRGFASTPEAPKAGEVVTVQAQIENIGTEVEQQVPVVFKVNGTLVEPTPRTIDLGVDATSPVAEFSYQIPIVDDDQTYELSVEAGPVTGETNIADNVATRTITVKAEPGSISGWVFDPYNIAVEGAIVTVVTSGANDYGSAKTDADGYFFLDGLKPGTDTPYTLEASKERVGKATKTGIVVHSQQTTLDQVFNLYQVQMDQITSGYRDTECDFKTDGSAIVFTREAPAGGLRAVTTVNVDGSNLRSLTGTGKIIEHGFRPEWSPDGQYLAFNGYSDNPSNPKPFGIYRVSAGGNGGDAVALVTGNWPAYPTWSPDSQWIAYVNGSDYEIWKVPAGGGSPTRLSQAGKRHESLAWSPDGSKIAYVNNMAQLGVFDVLTGADALVSLCVPQASEPTWLRDSSGILFAYGGDIWLYTLASHDCVQLTYEPSAESAPSVPRGTNAPDLLCFSSNRGATQYNETYVFTMAFAVPKVYFRNVGASPDPFTPNGDGQDDQVNISYTLNKAANVTLKIHDSQGKCVTTLAANVQQGAGTHVSTWDGRDASGNRLNDEVYSYRLDMQDGSEGALPIHGFIGLHKAVHNIGDNVAFPMWSPPGDKILYITPGTSSNNQVYICDAPDCTNKRQVDLGSYLSQRAPAWSSAGDQIVFPSALVGCAPCPSNLAVVGQAGGVPQEIDADSYNPAYPRWSPTGTEIVYQIVNGDALSSEYGYLQRYELVKISPSGGARVRLTNDSGEDQWPCWSPDGGKIAWSSDRTGNYEIWIMNADGSNPYRFTRNPWYDTFPEFTPDGLRLLFCSNRHLGSLGASTLWTQPLDSSDKARHLAQVGHGIPSPSGDMILATGRVIELFLSLTKGAIEGKGFDHETLAPIAQASVILYQGGTPVATTTTNASGGYQFYNIDPGSYTLNAEAAGYIRSADLSVEARAWAVTKRQDVELMREPAVHLTELAEGSVIGSFVSLNVAKDTNNVVSVNHQYRKVGEEWRDLGTTLYPYPGELDTRQLGLPSGQYEVRAVAMDADGNPDSAPSMVSVEVDHTPAKATVTAPHAGNDVRGTVAVSASCADADVVSVVFQYRKAGDLLWINVGSTIVVTPWATQWRTGNLIEGDYEVRGVAVDRVGNVDGDAQAVQVRVRKCAASDFDLDGDVDLLDFGHFRNCFNGDNHPPAQSGCDDMDFNGDHDVDLLDFGVFRSCFNGDNRPPACKPTHVPSDFDGDADVDLIDFAHFRSCYNEANRPPAQSGCDDMDFDGDHDVDLLDFGVFRSCFNGENRSPRCG